MFIILKKGNNGGHYQHKCTDTAFVYIIFFYGNRILLREDKQCKSNILKCHTRKHQTSNNMKHKIEDMESHPEQSSSYGKRLSLAKQSAIEFALFLT